ncbi:MAG: hypothetical protein GEU80_13630 [Dehalococcoidia bacterium]|nr:hypothetical protein [Dehalococcoidia bacterium]
MSSPPEWLQWTDIALSFVGFGIAIVAVPTILQMFFGAPDVRFRFRESVIDGDALKLLIVHVVNAPIRNKTLRRLGVRRESLDEIVVHYRVFNRAGELVREAIPRLKAKPGEVSQRTSVPASMFGVDFWLVAMNREGKTFINDGREEDDDDLAEQLPAGIYRVEVDALSSVGSHDVSGRFMVGTDQEHLHWDDA